MPLDRKSHNKKEDRERREPRGRKTKQASKQRGTEERKNKKRKQGRKSNDKKEIPRTNRYGGFSMLKLRRVSA